MTSRIKHNADAVASSIWRLPRCLGAARLDRRPNGGFEVLHFDLEVKHLGL